MYGLLTKREVKMAGYWPSSFFACLWTETKSSLLNKGFIIWDKTPKRDKLYLRDKARNPSGQDTVVAPFCRSGSQSQCEIRFILPTHGASHIINTFIIKVKPRWSLTEGVRLQDLRPCSLNFFLIYIC